MQAGRAAAVAGRSGLRGCHRTHRGSGRHRVPGPQARLDGFEAAPETVPVIDGQHRAVNHDAGETDPSRSRCADHSPGLGPQVHPAVAAEPRPVRRIEAAHHRGPGGERPGPAPCRRRACRHRPRPAGRSPAARRRLGARSQRRRGSDGRGTDGRLAGKRHRQARWRRRKGLGQRNGEQQREHREQGHGFSMGTLAAPEQAPGTPCGQPHRGPRIRPSRPRSRRPVGTPKHPSPAPRTRPSGGARCSTLGGAVCCSLMPRFVALSFPDVPRKAAHLIQECGNAC